MTPIPKKEMIYWYRQFRSLLSGWSIENQIKFHQYAITCLVRQKKGD